MEVATAVRVFACFAFAYFFSALVRGVTATLAPAFTAELGLQSAELGLLAGAYFFGFAVSQLPVGGALDRHGSRRVLVVLLAVSIVGCAAFAVASNFASLVAARTLIGVGVSACLMAPMTLYRRHFSTTGQIRANSWMLMTGSMGMVASTLPVQWLLPTWGWRGLFWALACAFVVALLSIWRWVPTDRPGGSDDGVAAAGLPGAGAPPRCASVPGRSGYREVFRHPEFRRFMPMGFFHYGGLIAVQSLWAGPWLVKVSGLSPEQAAQGLFFVNLGMLAAFMCWGLVTPGLYARGWTAQRLVGFGAPLSLVVLVAAVWAGPAAAAGTLTLFCVTSTVVSLSQPALGQAFPTTLAGRALSAYNLVIFLGIFVIQWGLGVIIDVSHAQGADDAMAHRIALGVLALMCCLSYAWFLWAGRLAASSAQVRRPTADI
jgi:MFS family permease